MKNILALQWRVCRFFPRRPVLARNPRSPSVTGDWVLSLKQGFQRMTWFFLVGKL